MDLIFHALGWIPDIRAAKVAVLPDVVHLDYTLWLNLLFGGLAVALFLLARKKPAARAAPTCCGHHGM